MFSQEDIKKVEEILRSLGLSEYQARVLSFSYALGKSRATDLSKASNVPKARIYSILEELCELRLIKKIETKPTLYIPIAPEEGLENLEEWKKARIMEEINNIQTIKEKNLPVLKKIFKDQRYYEEEFMEIIPVGTSSEIETKKLYRKAKREIDIVTRSFEYLPKVRKDLEEKAKKTKIKVLFLNEKYISEKDLISQKAMMNILKEIGAEIRISRSKLPIRYTLIDPDPEYNTGEILFLVEEVNVPVFMRYCVLSTNHSLTYGFKQYFDLMWNFSSVDI